MQVLNRNPNKRLGCMEQKHPIRSHPFFWEIDWDKLDKQLEPPFKPHVVRLCFNSDWEIQYDLLCMPARIVYLIIKL